jgi:hypothetical protein
LCLLGRWSTTWALFCFSHFSNGVLCLCPAGLDQLNHVI